MRYIRKVILNPEIVEDGNYSDLMFSVEEYLGYAMGDEWYATQGYHEYNGTRSVDCLDIVNGYIEDNVVKGGKVVELDIPEYQPSAEELAMEERDGLLTALAVQSIPIDDDVTAYAISPLCVEWEANQHYKAGEIVNHNGIPYRVIQEVDSLEHQYPGAEGMLAVYRPIDPALGTKDDPKTFYYGMDVGNGLYYMYNGNVYLAKADMPACVYYPGTEGMWQWELVTE